MYFASHGARTPFLALLAFRRPHNAVLVLAPFALMGALGILLAGAIRDAHAAGVVALVTAPALLAGPQIAARFNRPREAAAPLVLGSLALSLAFYAAGAPAVLAAGAPLVLQAGGAFLVAAAVGGALMPVGHLLARPIARAGDLALAALLVLAAIGGGPALDPLSFLLAAVAFALGAFPAVFVAALARRDPVVALLGAAVKDPGIAAAVAFASAGPVAASVPLAYAIVLLAMFFAALVRRRR